MSKYHTLNEEGPIKTGYSSALKDYGLDTSELGIKPSANNGHKSSWSLTKGRMVEKFGKVLGNPYMPAPVATVARNFSGSANELAKKHGKKIAIGIAAAVPPIVAGLFAGNNAYCNELTKTLADSITKGVGYSIKDITQPSLTISKISQFIANPDIYKNASKSDLGVVKRIYESTPNTIFHERWTDAAGNTLPSINNQADWLSAIRNIDMGNFKDAARNFGAGVGAITGVVTAAAEGAAYGMYRRLRGKKHD